MQVFVCLVTGCLFTAPALADPARVPPARQTPTAAGALAEGMGLSGTLRDGTHGMVEVVSEFVDPAAGKTFGRVMRGTGIGMQLIEGGARAYDAGQREGSAAAFREAAQVGTDAVVGYVGAVLAGPAGGAFTVGYSIGTLVRDAPVGGGRSLQDAVTDAYVRIYEATSQRRYYRLHDIKKANVAAARAEEARQRAQEQQASDSGGAGWLLGITAAALVAREMAQSSIDGSFNEENGGGVLRGVSGAAAQGAHSPNMLCTRTETPLCDMVGSCPNGPVPFQVTRSFFSGCPDGWAQSGWDSSP